MVHSVVTHETTMSGKEQVHVRTGQMGQHIKIYTIQLMAVKRGAEKQDLGKNSTQWTLW
jgi:hypothetical protein